MELERNLKPPKPGPRIKFWTPDNTTPVRFLVYSSAIWAHYVHWLGRHTFPCMLKLGQDGQVTRACEHCKAQLPSRWKGYLHGMGQTGHVTECFLCLTPNSGDYLMEALGADAIYRGLQLDVWRAGKSKTTELLVRVNTTFPKRQDLPNELDPAPYLDTVFRRRKPLNPPA